MPILNVDLTTEAGQAFVMRLLSEEHVLYVHMGPPCGTFTRARERPIPEWQMRMGAPCPPPPRSDDHPEGLPANELSELDLLKVRKGNAIAEFCAQVAQHCIEHGKYFSIENPTGSLLWKLPCYRTLLSHDDVRSVDFHACMWGSRRDKRTSFVTNMSQLECLRKICDGSHTHAPWVLRWHKGWKFATEEECEYPAELCAAVAGAAARELQVLQVPRAPVRRKQKSRHGPAQAAERATVGRQSRRHIRPEAVPERKPPSSFTLHRQTDAVWFKNQLGTVHDDIVVAGHYVPKGSRILRVVEQRTMGRYRSNRTTSWKCEVALPWSEEKLFQKAIRARILWKRSR